MPSLAEPRLRAGRGRSRRPAGCIVELLGLEVLVDEGGYVRIGGDGGFHAGRRAGAGGRADQAGGARRSGSTTSTRWPRRCARPGFDVTEPAGPGVGLRGTPGSTTPTAGRSRSTPRSSPVAEPPPRPRDPRRDPLDGVRPGGRRSCWLREALAAEPPDLAADVAAPPLAGRGAGRRRDRRRRLHRALDGDPPARAASRRCAIVVIESDICGGGPSGRNGGFVTGWWDELPGLIELAGDAEAVRTARGARRAIADDRRRWCEANAIDAWWTEHGFVSVSASPAQDDVWREATEACERVGRGDRWRALTREEVAGYARSPVFRGGAFMPGAGTVQPARARPRAAARRARARRRDPRADAGRAVRGRAGDDDLRRGRRHRPRPTRSSSR